jgi:hypothetical protein
MAQGKMGAGKGRRARPIAALQINIAILHRLRRRTTGEQDTIGSSKRMRLEGGKT